MVPLLQILGGTMPATYLWKGNGVSGLTTANLSNLGPGDYSLTITDANGCKTEEQSYLFEPPANGWNKTGNILDNSDFLGSTNNAPLVFKTANTEQLRISETGNIGIGTNNPQVKLDVNGTTNITGDLYARKGIKFDNTSGVTYNGANRTFTYGGVVSTGARGNLCAALPSPYFGHQFNGCLQVFDADPTTGLPATNTGILNLQAWTGGSSIDASLGGYTGTARLLLNYFCGNSTFINTGTNGGDVIMTSATLGKVGIGTDAPAAKLDVRGDVKISSLAGTGNNVVQVDNDGKLSIMPLATAGVGFWQTTNGTDIFHSNGNIGIGTSSPAQKLDINGGGITMSNLPSNWTESHWKVAVEVPTGSVWKTRDATNRPIAFGMTDAATSAGWYWIYPSTNAAGQEIATYPMNLTVDYSTFTTTLAVNGNIRAKDIVVTLAGWPDFVFEDSYKRMSIMEKEAYYTREKHLPYMSKGEDVIESGLQVGQNMNGMMQNIEENTLDIADLYKKIILLEKENSELKKRMQMLSDKK